MSTWRGYDTYLLDRARRAQYGASKYLDEETIRSSWHNSYCGTTLRRDLTPGTPDVFEFVESSMHPSDGRVYRVTRLTFTPGEKGEHLEAEALTGWERSASVAITAYRNRRLAEGVKVAGAPVRHR